MSGKDKPSKILMRIYTHREKERGWNKKHNNDGMEWNGNRRANVYTENLMHRSRFWLNNPKNAGGFTCSILWMSVIFHPE